MTLTGVCASAYGGVTEKTCAGACGSKTVSGTVDAPKCAPPSKESVRPTVTADLVGVRVRVRVGVGVRVRVRVRVGLGLTLILRL